MTLRLGVFVLAIAACATHAVAPPVVAKAPPAATSTLVAVDVFDPDPRVAAHVLAALEPELRRFGDDMLAKDRRADHDALQARVRTLGDFAYVEPALVGYYEPAGMTYYLTIDLVAQGDAARRIAFTAEPHGTHADPAGLIADWKAYEDEVHELLRTKRLPMVPFTCPVFHCLGDPATPELHVRATRFAADVPAHADELAAILRDDADETHRAAAAYLLAYTTDGAHLVELLVPAIRDPSSFARNSVMRVLAEIARNHPEVDVPLEPLLDALEFPATTDRNKAAATLDALLRRPDAARLHATVAARAGATLLAMLRLRQPNNHDFAYRILKTISGKSYGERDDAAWQTWLTR